MALLIQVESGEARTCSLSQGVWPFVKHHDNDDSGDRNDDYDDDDANDRNGKNAVHVHSILPTLHTEMGRELAL